MRWRKKTKVSSFVMIRRRKSKIYAYSNQHCFNQSLKNSRIYQSKSIGYDKFVIKFMANAIKLFQISSLYSTVCEKANIVNNNELADCG